jgi:hypothetical protein
MNEKNRDGHGFTGPFTSREFLARVNDHDRAVRNGMAAGPNVSYVRTHQAASLALKLAAPLLEQYYKDHPYDQQEDL